MVNNELIDLGTGQTDLREMGKTKRHKIYVKTRESEEEWKPTIHSNMLGKFERRTDKIHEK